VHLLLIIKISAVFYYVTPCSPVESYLHFVGGYCLHHQSGRGSRHVRLSDRPHGTTLPHWTNFYEIQYMSIFLNICPEN
jgi:hypothetical protein